MADGDEYRCFIGNLSWSTTDESLKDAFSKFGKVTEAKVIYKTFIICSFRVGILFVFMHYTVGLAFVSVISDCGYICVHTIRHLNQFGDPMISILWGH